MIQNINCVFIELSVIYYKSAGIIYFYQKLPNKKEVEVRVIINEREREREREREKRAIDWMFLSDEWREPSVYIKGIHNIYKT